MDTIDRLSTDLVPVAELIRHQARRTPRAIAVECGERRLTYARFDREVDALAARLVAAGAGPGQVVGVQLERGVDLVVALVAVLRTGAAYLPLDPDHPAVRREQLVADAGVGLVVTRRCLSDGTGVPALFVEDAAGGAVRAGRVAPVCPPVDPDDIAYLIYTSGSTGRPKGVMVTHGSLARLSRSLARHPGLASGLALVAVATIAFDMSVLELVISLTAGMRVVVADADQARDPAELSTVLTATRATAMVATPTTWQLLLDAGWRGRPGFLAMSGGEKLSPELAARLGQVAEVWDGYGPTETTVCVWWSRVTDDGPVDFALVDGVTAYVLDDGLNPVADGVDGEIYLVGSVSPAATTADRTSPPTATSPTPGPSGGACTAPVTSVAGGPTATSPWSVGSTSR